MIVIPGLRIQVGNSRLGCAGPESILSLVVMDSGLATLSSRGMTTGIWGRTLCKYHRSQPPISASWPCSMRCSACRSRPAARKSGPVRRRRKHQAAQRDPRARQLCRIRSHHRADGRDVGDVRHAGREGAPADGSPLGRAAAPSARHVCGTANLAVSNLQGRRHRTHHLGPDRVRPVACVEVFDGRNLATRSLHKSL